MLALKNGMKNDRFAFAKFSHYRVKLGVKGISQGDRETVSSTVSG